MRHCIDLATYTPEEIKAILDLSKSLKAQHNAGDAHPLLAGKTLGMIFEKPSTRTRMSFEVGMNQLGGHALYIRPDEIGMGVRETISDIAHVMGRYLDAVMIRAKSHQTIVAFSQASSVPVINGLSDYSHPCQALADALTILEYQPQEPIVAYIGDGNNVCQSLSTICEKLEIQLHVVCPQDFAPEKTGQTTQIFHNPEDGVKNADFVYTDVWVSMGQESESQIRLEQFKPFQVTSKLLAGAKPNVRFMHCLPAKRGEEVAADVIDGPASIIFDQAENRLHAQKGLLAWLLGGNQR